MEAESRAAPGDLEDNDLASGTIAIVDRIRPHLGTILLSVLVLFAALAAWTLIQSQTTARLAAGWDDCLAALAEGDPGRLETVAAQYGGTPAAQWAEIVLADTALADGNRLLITDRAQGVRRLEEAAGRYTAVNAQRPGLLAAERATFGLARAGEPRGVGRGQAGLRGAGGRIPREPVPAARGGTNRCPGAGVDGAVVQMVRVASRRFASAGRPADEADQ